MLKQKPTRNKNKVFSNRVKGETVYGNRFCLTVELLQNDKRTNWTYHFTFNTFKAYPTVYVSFICRFEPSLSVDDFINTVVASLKGNPIYEELYLTIHEKPTESPNE